MQIGQADATVVSLAGARNAMSYGALSEVRGYWEALRNGRRAPLRSEIDPRGIERALENAFILERVAPQVARFRLAGVHLNDLLGVEVRGLPVSALFSQSDRSKAAAAIDAVFSTPQLIEMTLKAEGGIGKPKLEAKLLILPLQSDLGDITRALGCLVAVGQIGRSPRKFDIMSVSATGLAGTTCSIGHTTPHMNLAETQAPLVAPRIIDRSHIRLVHSNS